MHQHVVVIGLFVFQENSTRFLFGATCHCPCCDIASAVMKPAPFLVQIIWVPLCTPEITANFADSNNTVLFCC